MFFTLFLFMCICTELELKNIISKQQSRYKKIYWAIHLFFVLRNSILFYFSSQLFSALTFKILLEILKYYLKNLHENASLILYVLSISKKAPVCQQVFSVEN